MSDIHGVVVESLPVFSDERGSVMRMMRKTDSHFKGFGEVYFSVVKPAVVKGWKKHVEMIQSFAVPCGEVKFVLYDVREDSPTKGMIQEVLIGGKNYALLQIPSGIWYSFASVENSDAMIVNCATHVHDDKECIQVTLDDPAMPRVWSSC